MGINRKGQVWVMIHLGLVKWGAVVKPGGELFFFAKIWQSMGNICTIDIGVAFILILGKIFC